MRWFLFPLVLAVVLATAPAAAESPPTIPAYQPVYLPVYRAGPLRRWVFGPWRYTYAWSVPVEVPLPPAWKVEPQ